MVIGIFEMQGNVRIVQTCSSLDQILVLNLAMSI